MKRNFLKELGLEKEVIDAIMKEYGKERQKLLNQIDDLTKVNEENEKLKEQVNELEGRLKDLEDMEAMQNELTQELEKHKLDKLKMQIAYEAGIPLEIYDKLEGKTEEELRKDAEIIAEHMTKQKKILPLAKATKIYSNDPYKRFVSELFGD